MTSPASGPAPPVLDLDANNSNGGGSDYASTFTIGGSPIPIADTDVKITDPDSTTMASATISMIVNGGVPPNDTLSISGPLPGGISASGYNPATGVLTLTGVASIAAYDAALHQVVFSTADTSSNADRIISVTVSDGAHTSNTAETFMHVVPPTSASVDIAATVLTEPDPSSLVTIHFSEAVTGFGFNDLTPTGGALDPLSFQQIDADTYQATFTADPDLAGTGQVMLTGAYTDLAHNPGITGAADTVDVNTLPSTLDATILTTGTSGLGQVVDLTFVDLQNPIFSYAGLYDLGAQGGTFQRDVGFDINPTKEYAVSLEATGETPVPISVLTVEGVTIHVVEGVVTLQLDNVASTILSQAALTTIIQPNDPIVAPDRDRISRRKRITKQRLVDPTVTPGSGAGSAENTVNYLYGAAGGGTLTGDNDTDVLNGGGTLQNPETGNDTLLGGAGNDVLIYDPLDHKIDGGAGTDVLRTDEAALGLLNTVGVSKDAATGFDVVEVVPFKQNIKNIEVMLITDDAGSSPTKGGLLNLNAQDVLDMTDPNNHTLSVLGNPGDVVHIGIGASQWNDNGKVLDPNGFHTFTQTLNGIDLILKVEHTIVVT